MFTGWVYSLVDLFTGSVYSHSDTIMFRCVLCTEKRLWQADHAPVRANFKDCTRSHCYVLPSDTRPRYTRALIESLLSYVRQSLRVAAGGRGSPTTTLESRQTATAAITGPAGVCVCWTEWERGLSRRNGGCVTDVVPLWRRTTVRQCTSERVCERRLDLHLSNILCVVQRTIHSSIACIPNATFASWCKITQTT